MKGVSKATIISGWYGCLWNGIAVCCACWLFQQVWLVVVMLVPSFFIGCLLNIIAERLYGSRRRSVWFSIFSVYFAAVLYWLSFGGLVALYRQDLEAVFFIPMYALIYLTCLPFYWILFPLSYLNHWLVYKSYHNNKSRVVTP